MDKVYFATSSPGKVKRLREAIPPGIEIIHLNIELPEPRTLDLKEIAEAKVRFAYNLVKEPVVALDSGFFVNSLNGFPATFVNFALETVGTEGILRLAEGKARECEFRNCLAFYDGLDIKFFESTQKGVLSETPRGERKPHNIWHSGLHRIFVPESYTRTLAEMNEREFSEFRAQRKSESFSYKFAKWIASYNFKK